MVVSMSSSKYPRSLLSQLYRTLYSIRVFENSCIQLYRQGLIRGYLHPYLGEEAIATGDLDGMAAANESLYLALRNGEVVCIKGK